MKVIQYLISLFIVFTIAACGGIGNEQPLFYNCDGFKIPELPEHPKAETYQQILDRNRKFGIVGATLMIKDKYGIWVGASGKADLKENVNIQSSNRFLIASISKVFTASAIYKAQDEGLLSIDDPISKWIKPEIISKIKQADECKISHLLSHTSGIADYYTVQFELDRMNKKDNQWKQEDILAYTYGKSPTNKVGETYYYSNTNFLILGMILEAATGLSLSDVYKEMIFEPLNLKSAYYSDDISIPQGTVQGYADIYGNGQYVESQFLYGDELGTGDGGIAINAYDLGIFFEKLIKGEVISQVSLKQMTNWFDLPEGWKDENLGTIKNGYGIEYNKTPYGYSVGHTGGIDGFLSIAQYFPDEDATFILLTNSANYDGSARLYIFYECLKTMFEK